MFGNDWTITKGRDLLGCDLLKGREGKTPKGTLVVQSSVTTHLKLDLGLRDNIASLSLSGQSITLFGSISDES